MSNLNPRLLRELKKMDPEVDTEALTLIMASDLDLLQPNKRIKSISAFTETELRVYTDGAVTHTVSLDSIDRFFVENGVGCVFASYIQKDTGERILFARANGRYSGMFGSVIKRINHYLRFHDLDFSRFSDAKGRICPKCGRPFPRGAQTCPNCTSRKKTVMRLLSLVKPEWKLLFLTVLLFFMTTAVSVLIPYVNRYLVDHYILSDGTSVFLPGFIGVIFSLLAAQILRRVFHIARSLILTQASNRMILRLRDMIFRQIQKLSISQISKRTSGELMKRVNNDSYVIKQFLVVHLPGVIEQGLLLIAISVIMFVKEWKLALLILIPAPFVAWGFRLFWTFMRGMFRRRWDLNSQGSAVLHDIFSGIRVVKSYGMEKAEEARFEAISAAERDAQIRQERTWSTIMPILQFGLGFGEYAILYYVGVQMLNHTMTPGDMSQFSSYAGMIFGPLAALMSFPRQLIHTMTSLTRVYEILDEKPEVADSANGVSTEITGRIDIEHISFGYEDADVVLEDVDLHIEPGEFVGLVGKSGVGKSTLINLIMRMYDVDEGAIRLDGVDIRDIPQEVLRSRMGVVLQENFLFAGTVWQNLTYAKPDATREEVIAAAKNAGAHEFIIRLPDGYDTYVGERGYTLSGGERQRISIARALLHDPKILILDEATASLDTETEKLIQDALKALSDGRTTIAIAHRLSTLRNANRLVVMDKGRIAEVGTHDALMEKKGIYYGLVMAQREMSKIEDSDNSDRATRETADSIAVPVGSPTD